MRKATMADKYCSIEAFFTAVASGNLLKVKSLNYSEKHLTTARTFSPPALKIYIGDATPLHVAAELGYLDIVEFLIGELEIIGKLKSYINYPDRQWLTPLHKAAEYNHTAIIELLIRKGAAIDKPGYGSETPLHLAAMNNHKNALHLLLKLGANPNMRTKSDNDTALHYAVKSKHPKAKEIIELLLMHGANTTIRNGRMETKFVESGDEQDENIILFKSFGAMRITFDGKTPAEIAFHESRFDIADLIKDYSTTQKSAFELLKYARIIWNHGKSGLFDCLPEPLYKLILLYVCNGFKYLKIDQVNAIVEYASNPQTLKNEKIAFLKNTVSLFFKPTSVNQQKNQINKSSLDKNKILKVVPSKMN